MLVLTCLPEASPAQQPASSQPAPVLKVQASDVVLPVTVRNKKGELVTSVKVSDFTLTEDSRPQKIKSFTRETSLPFRLGLLVDTSHSMMGVMESERKAAGKFVDAMLPEQSKAGPGASQDQAFLIHFDREVELLYDFTSSRDKLHRELDEMGPSRAANNEARDSESSGAGNGGNGGYGGGRGQGQGQGQSHGRRGGSQLYDAIYLASDEVMKNQEGRKALIVFSDGVDRGSKMTLNDAVDAADKAGLAVYTIYLKGEEERSTSGYPGSGGHRGGMGGGGYPGGGGGWPGGGGGRSGGGGQREPEVDGKKIMEKIATRTGGHFYEAKKKDNLDEIYGQIAEELRGQFLLTYTPDVVDKEGGFHKIVLKSNMNDLSVVTREGYYAPGGEAK
ncbi:MAG TPA: VWA domain-containing protein [Terracidiphilus sp.]|jgi:VWFA-related protein